MIVTYIEDEEYALTRGEKYEILQITMDERLLQVINDENEEEWYPASVFDDTVHKIV